MVELLTQPLNGHLTLPQAIDEVARTNPQRSWACIPKSSKPSDGYEEITFARFADAINRMAWFIESELGASKSFETFCYMGVCDVRYYIMQMAAAKTQYKVDDILAGRPMRHIVVPELSSLLYNNNPAPQYPFPKPFSNAQDDAFLIMHTSGSTGIPKPIAQRHCHFAVRAVQNSIPRSGPNSSSRIPSLCIENTRCLVSFLPFRVICARAVMDASLLENCTLVFATRDEAPSTESVRAALRSHGTADAANPESAFLSPAVLEQFAHSPETVGDLVRLRAVMYGGATVSQSCGSILIDAGVHLINLWGSTETGLLVQQRTAPEDWAWLAFDPDYNGLEWRVASVGSPGDHGKEEDQILEPVIVKDPKLEWYQAIFKLYPDLNEWPLGDLYTRHPSKDKPNTFKYYGRADDLVCFAHGVKFHPKAFEDAVMEKCNADHHVVSGVLMEGSQRNQAVLIVELALGAGNKDKLKELVWEAVQEVNKTAPSVAQIAKTHIVFVKADEKPFLRTAKETAQRKATVDAYKDEIDDVYRRHGDKGPEMGRVRN